MHNEYNEIIFVVVLRPKILFCPSAQEYDKIWVNHTITCVYILSSGVRVARHINFTVCYAYVKVGIYFTIKWMIHVDDIWYYKM